MQDWNIKLEDNKVIITHKDGSGVVVDETDNSSIAACILARLATDLKLSSLKIETGQFDLYDHKSCNSVEAPNVGM